MDDGIISEIESFVRLHPPPSLAEDATLFPDDFRQLGYTPRILYPVASKTVLAKTEADLGFRLPLLLGRLYTEVSNGIAGFSSDFMGLEGGCSSDSGTLVEAYAAFRTGDDYVTGPWKPGMLPFCNWGCAIYSCVDCTEPSCPIFTYENSGVWAERYTLAGFFKMWLEGKVAFSEENVEIVTREAKNPLTGEKITISARRRRKPGP
jgi:hypothetical protein